MNEHRVLTYGHDHALKCTGNGRGEHSNSCVLYARANPYLRYRPHSGMRRVASSVLCQLPALARAGRGVYAFRGIKTRADREKEARSSTPASVHAPKFVAHADALFSQVVAALGDMGRDNPGFRVDVQGNVVRDVPFLPALCGFVFLLLHVFGVSHAVAGAARLW